MEIAKLLQSPFLILLLVFLVDAVSSSVVDTVNGGYKKLCLNLQKQSSWMQMQNTEHSCIFQKPRLKDGTTVLEMKQRDYCSGKSENWDKNNQNRLFLDTIRVESLQSRLRYAIFPGQFHKNSESQLPLFSGNRLQTLNYIVTVGIGAQNLTLIVDTGSDLTWVQCSPCAACYSQQEPLYNPSASPSFRPLPCSSATCSDLRSETGTSLCLNKAPISPCDYRIGYGDGSHSRGVLAYERLNLGNVSIDDFLFGCGRNNTGLFGGVSGLMGLGKTELSLVSQTSSVFGGVFSYCLPSTRVQSSGSLTIGGNGFSNFKNVTPISYTKMVLKPEMSNYYLLNLTGIRVGGVKLNLPRLDSRDGGLSMIDSGTVITRLVPSIYRALKEEFEKQFSGFRSVPGFSILNTCYNLTGLRDVNIPTVIFEFDGGAEMVVDVEGIFYFVKSDVSQTCLAFASLDSDDQMMIIGNYQQKNQRVVYNVKESKVGFAGEPCGF